MTISVLDALAAAGPDVDQRTLPCLRNDPELFFAETPADVEEAKALCLDCPVRPSAWQQRSTDVNRGASGVASCSCKEQ
jgi:hypothetical protein